MNLKRLYLILLFPILMVACNKDRITGSGDIISQNRDVSGFSGIVTNGSTPAFITIGTGFSVAVKGYQNLLPLFEINVSNRVLQAGFKNNVNVHNNNTQLYVTLPALNYIQTNGNGDMTITGAVTGMDQLKAVIAGSANITIENGNADNFEGNITGKGNISGLGFQCKNASLSITGNGNMEISVSDSLNVTISGMGNIYYQGNPVVITHISGKGQVIKK
ncbi:MAG: GIN domain-containing protein [Chitinophagaceae bacterium]